ncbi:unnamed protein product [Adineta steineri]|uniref:Uncharacterized protein n=1 Tax=Adineta steineri TaxID=433720 RepID=A0A819P3A0_9BILA|nr:unnamed protein product [Adineta steineri]CAF4002022.1 unnamed protein product [Adineta steineri]
MQSTSSIKSNDFNFSTNTSNFWSNGANRKRKVDECDLEESFQNKMFLTEEKLIENMQSLSLDLSMNNNSTLNVQTLQENNETKINQNQLNHFCQLETQYELHKLFKDNLANNDLQDRFINKIYNIERKRFSMQIVPYIPIHPAQLNNNNNHVTVEEKEQKIENNISSTVKISPIIKEENDDHLFKRPFSPVPPYTVEEPTENTTKRIPRMKRSYSQSVRYNNNLTVVELKNDTNDNLIHHSQSDYFIVEPSTPALTESPAEHIPTSLSSKQSSIQIIECSDLTSSKTNIFSKPFTNDNINVKSNFSFDGCYEEMDDDDDI